MLSDCDNMEEFITFYVEKITHRNSGFSVHLALVFASVSRLTKSEIEESKKTLFHNKHEMADVIFAFA